ncbi:hypothetical protein PBY51_000017 [Eleginops maclovinus]|uniref:Uncharacterized protein n=1 Tax=Eleginops maclovinus TaxID=56733 RepID=A0AAN7XKR1_ELEMC|nr:hypothetical protein PBY51_000017 [Eleginops maclovinus]
MVEQCSQRGRKDNKERMMRKKKEESEEEEEQPPPCKRAIMSPLEELFAAEDILKMNILSNSTMSIQHQTDRELKMYQEMPPTMTSDDPAAWW